MKIFIVNLKYQTKGGHCEMPFVRVNYNEEKYNKKQLPLISKNILNSLIEEFNVPPKDYFQVFDSHKKEEIFYDKNYLISKNRTDGVLYIQITCGAGRTKEQKKSVIYEHCRQAIYKLQNP